MIKNLWPQRSKNILGDTTRWINIQRGIKSRGIIIKEFDENGTTDWTNKKLFIDSIINSDEKGKKLK